MSAAPDDRRAVAELLGRAPASEFDVVVRHADGSPLVIRNAPLLFDGTPMPTRYWLVGEPERRWVGRIEGEGGVDEAEGEVDPDELRAAHDTYARERDAALPAGHVGPRPSGGVAGTRRGVKCLHAHYAWFLAGGDDPVGRWVDARLAASGLRPDCVPAVSAAHPTPAGHEQGDSADVVAAVDCGTNSTRLLVARRAFDGCLETLDRRMHITRLGQDVDRTGRLAPEAIARTVAVLAEYRGVLEALGATSVRATATSAARDASNRDDFFGPAAEALGAPLELLPGEEEGRLSFAGATADLPPAPGGVFVFDLGGGSTELIWGSLTAVGDPVVHGVRSLDVGCVRVTERYLAGDPPTSAELAAARRELDVQLRGALDELGVVDVARVVGLAGTVSALASIAQGLAHYDRDRVHHHVLDIATVDELTDRLAALPIAARRQVVGLEAGRVEVIVGGCLVLQAVLHAIGAREVIHSEADILDGLAASLLR